MLGTGEETYSKVDAKFTTTMETKLTRKWLFTLFFKTMAPFQLMGPETCPSFPNTPPPVPSAGLQAEESCLRRDVHGSASSVCIFGLGQHTEKGWLDLIKCGPPTGVCGPFLWSWHPSPPY